MKNLNELSKRIDELKNGCGNHIILTTETGFRDCGDYLETTYKNEYNKKIFMCENCKIRLETIKQTLTAMFGELDKYGTKGHILEAMSKDVQKLIDKINGEKT